jgi:hypothetical protein
MMSPDTKKIVQLVLVVGLVLATARVAYIFYQRHEEAVQAERQKKAREVGYANADYYVMPKKLYPFDLKSAKQLTQQPVWVKEGYRYKYFPYDAVKKGDFDHDAGLLLPIEKLTIRDVITALPKGAGQQRQALAVFEKDGKIYAVPIGYESDGAYKFYADEMFYYEDPHDLYKHWPADVWQAVDQHKVKEGMTEMQAVFAIGMGMPDAGDTSYSKTVRYPNGGKPVVIVYHDGKAAEIKSGT